MPPGARWRYTHPMPRRRIVHHPRVLYVVVERDVHAQLVSLARARRLTVADIVRRLVAEYVCPPGDHPPSPEAQ